eukprot:CAMPEP_0181482462 /NCGR_PEP_ID=MMETSP1110-20121109/44868_1 /TAXON_ID=174948 /ORGANISM="Symbiodinium sp., Strain CCMP421" /LENGTH=577 /DNA_ID=CAMNT_0023608043 /DNA_START=30 /DNA_END=1763 /DNA_ORIENTATION=+
MEDQLDALRSDVNQLHLLQVEATSALRNLSSERWIQDFRRELQQNVKRPLLAEIHKLSCRLGGEPGMPGEGNEPATMPLSPARSMTNLGDGSPENLKMAQPKTLVSQALSVTFHSDSQDDLDEAKPKQRVQDAALNSVMPKRTGFFKKLKDSTQRVFAESNHDIEESMKSRGVRMPCAAFFLNVVPTLTIVANAVVIGLQSDISPDSVVWEVFEIVFITVYFAEFVLKLRIFGLGDYFCGKEAGWNLFDFICLILSFVDVTTYYIIKFLSTDSSANLSSLMLVKMFRLGRLVRLVRLVRHRIFHELKVMLFGLWAGIRVLGWAIVLLFVLIYMFGVFLRNIMGENFTELESVPSAMFTLFRCFRDDCASYDGTPFPERVRAMYGGVFMVSYILMIMTVSVGVFNLIMAIFIDNVTGSQLQRRNRELAESSERVRVIIKEHVARFMGKDLRSRRTYFNGDLNVRRDILDASLDENEVVVHRESFQRWLQDPEFTEALEEAYIDVSNKAHLFDIMDADMGGHLSLEELVEGLMALRGTVNKGDIISMSLKIRLLTRHVECVTRIVKQALDPGGQYAPDD